MSEYPKRLIEVDLPIKRISEHARREKNIRRGHISTLHIWWARRPLASCRAVICAALWPDPADEICPDIFIDKASSEMRKWAVNYLNLLSEESFSFFVSIQKKPDILKDHKLLRKALLNFIADFANWDNSNVSEFLETSRALTRAAHAGLDGGEGFAPLVVDPFAGGGAIPLEALRVGADTFASDLNPVSVFINKLILDYLPKNSDKVLEKLIPEAERVSENVLSKVSHLFSSNSKSIMAYIWSRTIRCEGPNCGVEIPLASSLWLSKRKGKYAWIEYTGDKKGDTLSYEIKSSNTIPPKAPVGTSSMGSATCPACGYTTKKKSVYAQLVDKHGGARTARLLAVVVNSKGELGRRYFKPTSENLKQVLDSNNELSRSGAEFFSENINPISPGKFGSGVASPTRIGCSKFGDLFTSRQHIVLNTFIKEVKKVKDNLIRSLLACAIDRLADYNSAHCRWNVHTECVGNTFGRQAISISWCFAEVNPFSGVAGDWIGAVSWINKVVENLKKSKLNSGNADRYSATDLPLPDDSAAALVTDPPYYGAVMYADLSDYFYILLKRSVGNIYTKLFENQLVLKQKEIIATPTSRGPNDEAKDSLFYEKNMCHALSEGRRIVTPTGIGVVVFAHKSTSGWEAMLSALIEAGWVVTSSWPIDTERQGRTNAQGTASLGSSVHLVVRPRKIDNDFLSADKIGDWRDVLSELPKRIHEWMPRLSEEGIVGADAIFSCLGPALEIFSRYSSVEKVSGEKVELIEYLESVWAAVAKEALNMIFKGADASGFEEDARLTAMWLWTLRTSVNNNGKSEDDEGKTISVKGYTLEFDAARKIAQGLGAHLDNLHHLVETKGDQAILLSAGSRTQYLFGKNAGDAPKGIKKKKSKQLEFNFADELKRIEEESSGWSGDLSGRPGGTVLDQLHQSMILFGAGRGEALKRFLIEDGIGRNPLYWRLAQALSALYPSGTDEKRWVDGVLARKKSLGF